MTKDLIIRTKKLLRNRLLQRRQFVLDSYHPEAAAPSNKQLGEEVARKYRVPQDCVVIFGTKTKFGGGKSTCFGLIYDNKDALVSFEPAFRLRRAKLAPARDPSSKRRTKKERKNKMKKFRGKQKQNALKLATKKKGR